jgi:ankyrin repeat protein
MSDVDAAIQAIKDSDTGRIAKLLAQDPGLAGAKTSEGLSILTTAAYYGRADIVALLLASEPELDIFEASTVGRTARVEQLADAGADLGRKSPDGFTPLHLAAFFGHTATVGSLLRRSAPVDVVSENDLGVRPLNSAVAGGHSEIVRLLLEHGADPDAPERAGYAPLHAAAENGDVESTRLLLAAGADPSPAGPGGRSPSDLAREKGHDAVVDLIAKSIDQAASRA